MPHSNDTTVGVAGLGAIGMTVARFIDQGKVEGMKLAAVSARDQDRAAQRVAGFAMRPGVTTLAQLPEFADVIVECAPAAVFADVARPAIARGRCLMPLSAGAFLNHLDLIEEARTTGARIIVPTGALIGLDTVRAMAVGQIHQVLLQTRKPPAGLAGAPYLAENGIDLENLTEAVCVFRGHAGEAAQAFPANVNVAAALALAGVGPERTSVEVWADPSLERNQQSVTITSDSGEATMTMNNVPSTGNPRTGRIVANSVIATLQRMTAPFVSGT